MHGASGFAGPPGVCIINFVTNLNNSGSWSGSGNSADRTVSMSWGVRNLSFGSRKMTIWIWERPHFLNSIVQTQATAIPRYPFLEISALSASTFALKTLLTKSGLSCGACPGSKSFFDLRPIWICSHCKKEISPMKVPIDCQSILTELSHKDTTVYQTIQFEEWTQCVKCIGFPGPLEPMNKDLLYWKLTHCIEGYRFEECLGYQ